MEFSTFHAPTLDNVDVVMVYGDGVNGILTSDPPLRFWTKVNMDITGWTISGDVSGSVSFKVEVATYAAFPTFTEILTTEQPTLTAQQKNQDLALVGTPVQIRGYTAWRLTPMTSGLTIKRAEITFHEEQGDVMAILDFDGFDDYTTMNDRWTAHANATIGAFGRNGTQGLQIEDNVASFTAYARRTFAPTEWLHSSWEWRFDMMVTVNDTELFHLMDGVTRQVTVLTTPSGRLRINNGNGTTILGSGTFPLIVGAYYFAELKVTIGNAGAAQLWLNGVSEIGPLTPVDTQNSANAVATGLELGDISPSGSYGAVRFE